MHLIVIVSCRDFEIVGHVLPVVLNLPSSCHVAVRHTNIKVVGELAEWIEKHPDYLGTCALYMVWFDLFLALNFTERCVNFFCPTLVLGNSWKSHFGVSLFFSN